MGRKICSTLPQMTDSLVPQRPYLEEFRRANKMFKEKQMKANYDHCHHVQDLPGIPDHTDVWVTPDGHRTTGKTVSTASTQRSYIIQTPSGEIRRNRSQLNIIPSTTKAPTKTARNRSPIMTHSRTGTAVNPLDRLVA